MWKFWAQKLEIYYTLEDCFRKNRKDAAEELMTSFIETSTSSIKLKEGQKYSHGMDWLQKANDMVSQTWIIECLKIDKISDNSINFITEAIKNWQVELTAGGKL